jgi:hypothetical protein
VDICPLLQKGIMVSPEDRNLIKLVSNPYQRRSGLLPITIGVVLGWIFSVLWFCVSILALPYNPLWSALVAASTIAFSIFLGAMTASIVSDAYRDYQIELNETEVVLIVIDRLRRRRSTQMVLLDDIKYAEYYPYSDSASVILHATYIAMEVPLWPMGGRAQDVIDFLSGRGIRVMNVQFDDKVPV